MRSNMATNPLATLSTMLGALMVTAVPAATTRLSTWAEWYGAPLVYLAFLEYVAVAAGLVRWGVKQWRL